MSSSKIHLTITIKIRCCWTMTPLGVRLLDVATFKTCQYFISDVAKTRFSVLRPVWLDGLERARVPQVHTHIYSIQWLSFWIIELLNFWIIELLKSSYQPAKGDCNAFQTIHNSKIKILKISNIQQFNDWNVSNIKNLKLNHGVSRHFAFLNFEFFVCWFFDFLNC